MDTRAHVFYSGSVQGVGFRYTVRGLASESNLKGWVKNLRDGRVEMIAEGEKEAVEELIKQIDDHFSGYVTNKEIHYEKPSSNLPDFSIAF